MIIDSLVVLVVFASAFISFLRGFIREVLTIFGIVGGMIASYIGGPILLPHMNGWLGIVEGEEPQKLFDLIPYPMLSQVLSYGAILVVFVILLSIFSHFLAEFARSIGLGALDRTLGVVFGIARGVLLLGLIYLPFFYFMDDKNKEEWFKGSKTHIYLEATSGWLAAFIPPETQQAITEQKEKLEETNETRKRLEDLDLLNKGQQGQEEQSQDKKTKELGADPEQEKPGYTQEFRNQMNELIEKATGENGGALPPSEQQLQKVAPEEENDPQQ